MALEEDPLTSILGGRFIRSCFEAQRRYENVGQGREVVGLIGGLLGILGVEKL